MLDLIHEIKSLQKNSITFIKRNRSNYVFSCATKNYHQRIDQAF